MWLDAYADKYQKINGFPIKLKVSNDKYEKGYLSLKPSTRSTYDIAMRDATIDGQITMDNIEELIPGRTFTRDGIEDEIWILQSANKFEFQIDTKNINAIKQNCYVDVLRQEFGEYKNIYTDIIAFVTMQSKDEKNFAAGTEDNTILTIQLQRFDSNQELPETYELRNDDRIILKSLDKSSVRNVKVESINSYAIPGVIMLSGTFDTRTE